MCVLLLFLLLLEKLTGVDIVVVRLENTVEESERKSFASKTVLYVADAVGDADRRTVEL